MSILQKLTEGIVSRDLSKEGAALLNKWEKTGLLEGLKHDHTRSSMARLLENQAKELLREAASAMAAGDVEGFASVAFPIVRRVFGSLIANDLVSVQPMSLPSGLIFFLDFTFEDAPRAQQRLFASGSLYGGNVIGQQLTGGVDLEGNLGTNAGQFYNLTNGYSSPSGTFVTTSPIVVLYSGSYGTAFGDAGIATGNTPAAVTVSTQKELDHVYSLLQYDPDFTSGTTNFAIAKIAKTDLDQMNFDDLVALKLSGLNTSHAGGGTAVGIRRLTQYSSSIGGTPSRSATDVLIVLASDSMGATALSSSLTSSVTAMFPIADNFAGTPAAGDANSIGSVVGADSWGLEDTSDIPEINLKVDSVSVTAVTKKLKAKWTPELGQDLNAYHNLDAEVELTSILSEQIALEIDREIMEDLVRGASAAVYHWARSPGLFVDKRTGGEVGASAKAPDFTGTVSEWYETLGETINDVSAQIHRKTLRGGANFLVTSPEVANILEFTSGFRANVTHDDSKGTAGTQQVGSLSKRYEVYVDPYFPRNLILVGRKGSSFLESGYVYSPYVPLQVTPTIFGVEDFVPRKGVMTRYAKKMVRPDMYGLVVVRGMLGESGN
jgi:hypothetical protein